MDDQFNPIALMSGMENLMSEGISGSQTMQFNPQAFNIEEAFD
jgi:hypothetical protein